jgi:hypothetical protein
MNIEYNVAAADRPHGLVINAKVLLDEIYLNIWNISTLVYS